MCGCVGELRALGVVQFSVIRNVFSRSRRCIHEARAGPPKLVPRGMITSIFRGGDCPEYIFGIPQGRRKNYKTPTPRHQWREACAAGKETFLNADELLHHLSHFPKISQVYEGRDLWNHTMTIVSLPKKCTHNKAHGSPSHVAGGIYAKIWVISKASLQHAARIKHIKAPTHKLEEPLSCVLMIFW